MLKYPKDYLDDVMVRFAYNSNAIEGNKLTLGQTRAVILNETITSTGIEGVKLKDLYAADNQKDAFNELIYLANNNAPLNMDTLLKLQFELTKNTIAIAGKFKTNENYIAGADFKTASPQVVYQLMHEWIDNTSFRIENSKNDDELLRTLIETHIDFEKMHPFDDGNGRTGRELINLELAKHEMSFLVVRVTDRPFYLQNLADRNVDNLVGYAKERMAEEKDRYTAYVSQNQKQEQFYKDEIKKLDESTISAKEKIYGVRDTSAFDKTDIQLNRVYARKFLKENHFEVSDKNIKEISENIALNRINNREKNKDFSVQAGYKSEKEKLDNSLVKKTYNNKFKEHNNHISKELYPSKTQDQNLEI